MTTEKSKTQSENEENFVSQIVTLMKNKVADNDLRNVFSKVETVGEKKLTDELWDELNYRAVRIFIDGLNSTEVLNSVTLPITVVFPYLASKAQGNELLFAVRCLERNFREDFKVVVIGDKEDWFSDEIIYIPADVVSENPQIDTLHKLKLAISDERVSDGFIWMNDDIYFISPVLLADIQILTAQGKLTLNPEAKGIYDINKNKTFECINKLGNGNLPTHYYDTHTPFYYEKERLVSLFENVPELSYEGLLPCSIYFNAYYPDHHPLQVDGKNGHYLLRLNSVNPGMDVFKTYMQGKKFLNNAESGYGEFLVDFLQTNFPGPSRFEKE